MIDFKDISVVIQGPVERAETASSSFITADVCKSVRELMPGAEIIVSTWEDCDTSDLDYDKLIKNKNITANRIYMPNSNIDKLHTVNHQIITTHNGISQSNRKYILKLRSDTKLINLGFISYFEKYNEYPKEKQLQSWKILSHRVVCLPTYNIHKKNGLAFNICDWTFFGLYNDMNMLFDIPLVDTFNLKVRPGEKYPRVEDNFGTEQVIWIECIKKKRPLEIRNAVQHDQKTITEFEISLAINFIPVSAKRFGIYNIKYGDGGYGVEPYLSHGFYTFRDWQKLYNKYGGGHIKPEFNVKEEIIYGLYQMKDSMYNNNATFAKAYDRTLKAIRRKR